MITLVHSWLKPLVAGAALLVATFPASAAEVETKTVEVVGTGALFRDAINDGLVEAISQVFGTMIEANTAVKTIEVSATDGKDESYFSGQAYRQKISSATKGAVKEYTIVKQGKNAQGLFELQMSVTCLKVKPFASSRKRVVCATFGSPEKTVASQALITSPGGMFTDNLEACLVQSRRFMVLDRRQTESVSSERKVILEGNVSIEDAVKVSIDYGADLVLAGSIVTCDYSVKHMTMRSGVGVDVGEGLMEVSFRIIDVGSRQVKYADRIRYGYSDEDLRKLSGAPSATQEKYLQLMNVDSAKRASRQIIDAIYPPMVVSMNGDVVTLDEGGICIEEGQVFDVFSPGKTLTSTHTGENLGPELVPVGKIRITTVGAKTSMGTCIDNTLGNIKEGCICRLVSGSYEVESKTQITKPGQKIKTDELF